MGRMYTATFSGVSSSGVADFFEITAPATGVVIIHEVHITQDDSETSQQQPVSLVRVPATATSGSGGTSPNKNKVNPNDASASATVEANNTTGATTSGTLETLRRNGDNVLNGWHWVFTPETRPVLPPSGMLVVRQSTALSPAGTMSGELVWEEI